MNNDDVKKYIDISKLYTEVELDENKKVDEGILDWLEDKLGINKDEAEEVVKEIPPKAKTELDAVVDDNKLSDKTAQDNNPNIQGNNFATDADGNVTSTDEPKQPGDGDADAQVGKSFTDIGQAMANRDQVEPGEKVTIGGQEATVYVTNADGPKEQQEKFFLGANGKPITSAATAGNDGSADSEAEPETDGSTDAVGSEAEPEVTDQEGGVAQGMDQADAADAEPVNTKDLMTRYNEGGKKAMPEIKKLQTELSRLGFDPNGIDGKYGNGTYKAVQQFQKANGLSVDGQAGTDTLAAIEKAITGEGPGKGEAGAGDGAGPSKDDGGASVGADTADDGRTDAEKDAGAGQSGGDDAMDPKNQQQDIDTAQPNADVDRYIELLNKLEGGQVNAGTPNATQGKVVASYDFRDLITLVESKLNEQLTQAEMAELKALHDKVQGHVGLPGMDDEKITNALNRYLKLVDEPAKKQAAQNDSDDLGNAPTKQGTPTSKLDTKGQVPQVTLDSLAGQFKKGMTMQQFEKIVKDAEALEPEDAAKDANVLKKLGTKAMQLLSTADYRSRYVIAKGAQNLGLKGLYRPDGSSYIFTGSDGKPAGAKGADLKAALAIAQVGLLPAAKVASIKKIADKGRPKFQAVIDAHNKATGATPQVNKQVPPSTGRPDDAGATQQNASKDNNMKKAIKEASMNISINGDSAAEVAELAGILKNAGMPNAEPAMAMDSPVRSVPGGAAFDLDYDGHDDMVSKMRLMEPPSSDSPCGMDEEGVEEDWDNSPDESYADTQTMTHDLSGGINRQKKAYAKAQDGDNAMAVETSIKEQLWAALNEKMTAEGRGRGKTLKASRGEKLNASRGNKLMASRGKDKKTTEGSRGKKSRGKKSRG